MSDAFLSRTADAADLPAIEDLHDRVFGPGALTRTAYRIREGIAPLSMFCRVGLAGSRLIACVRFTPVRFGRRAGALLLGPLSVAPEFANQGFGRRLVREGLDQARRSGVEIVVLVGDMAYYDRLGFKPVPRGTILLPGPVDLDRLLVAELIVDASGEFRGHVTAERDEPTHSTQLQAVMPTTARTDG